MIHFHLLLFSILSSLVASSVIPPPEYKTRVLPDQPLSEEEHFADDVHNKGFDHEAFLGRDEAKTFDQLTSEESKDRLAIIYDKIDKDGDRLLTEDELTSWIQYIQTRYIRMDTDRQWNNYKAPENGTIAWDTYKQKTYGHISDEEGEKDDRGYNYRDMMRRDMRRWGIADQNGDGALTKEEFVDFIHPEESKHMRDIIIDETLEDMDKNKDGGLSIDEYLSDMWPKLGSEDEEEPDWVKTEREQFHLYRDQDKDGILNRKEVRDWIIPPDYDHTRAEARHLMYNADTDRDEKLSKEEVLTKYDIFVGSQATDFGEALRKHDEF